MENTRDDIIKQWIKQHCGEKTTYQAASSDASFRRYFRLFDENNKSYILMDAPPDHCECYSFIKVAELMEKIGLNVPKILKIDIDNGILLLSDLGNQLYLQRLNENPQSAKKLFADATNTLIKWQLASKPNILNNYDDNILFNELNLFNDWFIKIHIQEELTNDEKNQLDKIYKLLINNATSQPNVYVHRDFMPRNLMICQDNPGVLDFQDALYGPICYDTVCLFRDAFISWDEEFELDCLLEYWEKARAASLPVSSAFSDDFANYYRSYELMGLQRHLKVIGIFCRLHYRDGKSNYIKDLPRFFNYLRCVSNRYGECRPLLKILDRLFKVDQQVLYSF